MQKVLVLKHQFQKYVANQNWQGQGCRSFHRNSAQNVSTPEKPMKSLAKGITSETSVKNACKTGKSKLSSVQKIHKTAHQK